MSRISSEAGFLAKQSTIYGLGSILTRMTGLLLLPVYTHYLTASDYGMKELLTISTGVVSVLIASAVSASLYRIYFQYDDDSTRRKVISSGYVSMGVLGGLVVACFVVFADPLAALVLDDSSLGLYITLSFLALWFAILNRISFDYLRARQKAVQVVGISLMRLVLAIGINILFIVHFKIGVVGVLWSALITSGFVFFVLTIPQLVRVGLRFSWPVMREMLAFGLPLVPAQLGAMVVHLSDRFFIKEMLSIADAGLYSLGYRFGTLPNMFVVEPFNQTWQPRRFEIHKQPDHEAVFGRIFTYYLFFITFCVLAVSAMAKDLIIMLAAPEFIGAAKVIPVIAVANAIFSLHYHLGLGLLLEKKTKIVATINLSNAGLVLLLNWLLIPRFGVYGAAYATLAAMIFKVSWTYGFSRRYYRPNFEKARIGKLLILAVLLYVAALLVNPQGFWLGVGLHLALVGFYPVILWQIGFFLPGEKEKAISVARRLLRLGSK